MDFATNLPVELVEHIFSFLTAKELAIVSTVSRIWRDRSNVDKLWLHQCMIRGWMKYGVTSTILRDQTAIIPKQNTNLLGNSPYYGFQENDELNLSNMCKWKSVFLKVLHLQLNWRKGRYYVSPIMRAHTEKISAMDANGELLVTVSPDKLMILWDLSSQTCLSRLDVHPDGITDVKIKGQIIVTSCNDGKIRVFDGRTGSMRMTLSKHNGSADILEFDGKTVVSAGSDRTIRIWDLATGKERFTCLGHGDDIECLFALRNQSGYFEGRMCTGSWDTSIIVWNLKSGEQILLLSGHSEVVTCCQMDSDKVISGSADGTVKIWSMLSGRSVNTLEGDYGEIYCLAFNKDVIAAGSSYSVVVIWSITGELQHELKGHLGIVRCLYLDEDKLISGGDQKKILIWDYRAGEKLYTAHRHPTLLHKMLVTETKIIAASPEKTGTVSMLCFW